MVDHVLDHLHLLAALVHVVGAGVPPPVPAGIRVGRVHRTSGIRVQHDDVVGFGPAVEAGVLGVLVTNRGQVLLAAVYGLNETNKNVSN